MSARADIVKSRVEVIPTRFALGAEVRCGDLRKVDDDVRRVLRQAWLDHLVLLFRGQSFTPQDLVNFAKIFGEIDRAAHCFGIPGVPAARDVRGRDQRDQPRIV